MKSLSDGLESASNLREEPSESADDTTDQTINRTINRTSRRNITRSITRPSAVFSCAVAEHLRVFMQLEREYAVLESIAVRMVATLRAGGKILFCGNGGSAADAQHLAAELVGRYRQPRRGLAAMALTTDSSVLTSIANDFGYGEVFRRQVQALAMPGDILVGLSTSGTSENVCAAMEEARKLGVYSVAMTGGSGGRLAALADLALLVPSSATARVQEAHLFCGHVLCELVENALIEEQHITQASPLLAQQGGMPVETPAGQTEC